MGGRVRRRARGLVAVAALTTGVLAVASVAANNDIAGPPWTDGAPPLPPWVKSIRIPKADQPILSAPSGSAPRRGSAALEVRLPVYAARRGDGCRERWLSVGPNAWICQDAVELSGNPFIDAAAPLYRETPEGLPFRYFFVGPDGSLGYKRLEVVDVGEPDFELQPGFAVAVVEERSFDGGRYGRTNNGLWLPMRDLGLVRPMAFRGEELSPEGSANETAPATRPAIKGRPADPVSIGVAWVVVDKARVFAKPSQAAPSSETRARFEAVRVLEEASSFAGKFLRIGDNQWLAAKDVRNPTLAPPPAEVDAGAGERWIDVDLATQTLTAYEGARPVFATLVSTGKGRQGTETATPIGTHRVWIKLLSSNMDNLEDDNASRYYRIEDVPWVQYFSKGVGLHGAFWHRSFGHVRSHGCVNLSPLDAQRLFGWTSPRIPAGWTAAAPSAFERGTVVRVR